MIANPIPWPGGARCAVTMTWDMDADSAFNWYNQDTADNLVAAGRATAPIAIPRLVEQFKRHEPRLTFFVPGWVIEKYPGAERAVRVQRCSELPPLALNQVGVRPELYR